jgi:RNA chaperone Hfq
VAFPPNLGYDTHQYLKAKQTQAAAEARSRIYVVSNTVKGETVPLMANSSHIPLAGLPGFPSERLPKRSAARLQTVPASPAPQAKDTQDSTPLPLTGPRKLVRPTLPARSFRNRAFNLHDEPAILGHQNMGATMQIAESSHAEAFYFQKQVQSQTRMVVVLENGEQIEGCIEWYDRNSIKVKGHTRMLVYKGAIKYIYKAGEKHL